MRLGKEVRWEEYTGRSIPSQSWSSQQGGKGLRTILGTEHGGCAGCGQAGWFFQTRFHGQKPVLTAP